MSTVKNEILLKEYKCLDKSERYTLGYENSPYPSIFSDHVNKAKMEFVKFSGTKYKDCMCKVIVKIKPGTERIGEVHRVNSGELCKIIEYYSSTDCTIMFEDGTIINQVVYSNLLIKEVKNPYRRSKYGVGYMGEGIHSSSTSPKAYRTWRGILERSYSKKFKEKHPTYKDCTVDERWHNFQVFAQWFYENYNFETMEGWHLDKDILIRGNKLYSPETCCFIPHIINNMKLYYIPEFKPEKYSESGKIHYKFQITVRDSSLSKNCSSREEAVFKYLDSKKNYAKDLAEEFKDVLNPIVYNKLKNISLYE